MIKIRYNGKSVPSKHKLPFRSSFIPAVAGIVNDEERALVAVIQNEFREMHAHLNLRKFIADGDLIDDEIVALFEDTT